MSSSGEAELQELASMVVRIIGDGSSYTKMTKDAKSSTEELSKTFKRSETDAKVFGKTIDDLGTHMSNMAGQFRAMAALGSPFQMVKSGVGLAAEAEQMEVSYATMLQSAEKGKQLVTDLQNFAATTPLNLKDVQNATKTLLQFGIAGDSIIPTLRQIGDVTGGDAQKVQSMSLAFGQMLSTGRLMGQDLLQMINAGVNPLQIMAENMAKQQGNGATADTFMPNLKKQMEAGQVSTKMVSDALKSATQEGGKFFGLMEKQSKTLSGLYSTMKDDVDAALREVGKFTIENFKLKDILMAVSKAAQAFTEWFTMLDPAVKKGVVTTLLAVGSFGTLIVTWKVGAIALGQIIGVLKDMVITFGWLKGMVAEFALSVISLLNPLKLLTVTIEVLTLSVKLLMKAFVIGLIIAAIVDLIDQFGGVEEAIKGMKDGLVAFWEGIQPVVQAFQSLMKAVWESLKQIWAHIRDFLSDIFKSMGIEGGIAWTDIRDFARNALLAIEYGIKNLDKVWALILAGMRWKFIEFTNVLVHFFTKILPSGIEYLAKNWKLILTDIFEWMVFQIHRVVLVTSVMGKIIQEAAADLIGNPLLTGEEVARRARRSFDFEMKKIDKELGPMPGRKRPEFEPPERIMGEWELKLKSEFDKLKGEFKIGWEEFKKMKLEEFAQFGGGGDIAEAEKLGASVGTAINKGMGKELGKLDAVLKGSAESFSRIASYQDAIRGSGGPNANPMVAAQNNTINAVKQGDNAIVAAIQQGNKNLEKIANKKDMPLDLAGFDLHIETVGLPPNPKG